MNKSQLISHFSQDQRKDVVYPNMRREVTPNVVRLVDTSGNGEGIITYSQLNKRNAEEAIREQVRYFDGIGQDFEWKVYDYDQPPDLKEGLRANGFTIGEVEALLVLNLEKAPEVLSQPVRHDVQQSTEPER